MPVTAKLKNLNRLKFREAFDVLAVLIKKKLRQKVTQEELTLMEFFDCLALANGYITTKTDSFLYIQLKGIYKNKMIKLRLKESSDIAVFKQVLCWEGYRSVREAYTQYFGHKDTLNIIDAGGNIGLTALYFYSVFENSQIVTVEPEPTNFESLSYNLKETNVQKILGAVWNQSASVKLLHNFRDRLSWSTRVELSDQSDVTTTKGFTIEDLRLTNHFDFIDILKIDIEGAEKELFALGYVDFLQYTKCVAIEIHDEFDCREDIEAILVQNDFFFFDAGELTIAINKKLIPVGHIKSQFQ